MRLLVIAALVLGTVWAAPDAPQRYSDRVLVCLQPDLLGLEVSMRSGTPVTGLASLDMLIQDEGILIMEPYLPGATPDDFDGDIYLANIYRMVMEPGRSTVSTLVSRLEADPFILYAESEAINRPSYEPNDTRWYQLWYLERIETDLAWDLWDIPNGNTPNSRDVVLASIDTGVMYTHVDLAPNAWVNQAEIPADIIDDVDTNDDNFVSAPEVQAYVTDYDGSGTVNLQDAMHSSSPFMDGIDADDWDSNPTSYVDDLFGWDVAGVTSGNDPDNDPMAAITGAAWIGYRSHGTNVAGNLAATTDNATGISSSVYDGLMMSVKCMYNQDSDGYVTGGYTGMLYAARAGANIINCSWGSYNSYSQSDQAVCNVIYNDHGALIVASSGNGNDNGTPNDYTHYPSGYENVVSVTAVGPSDNFSWATYGETVDLSAPGENIWTTTFNSSGSSTYESTLGTSFSSPITASAFGLLKIANPQADNDWLVEAMLGGADPIDDLNPDYAGGLGAGRVNVYNAIARSLFPSLSYHSYSLQIVNDNGDGQLNPGEETQMRVNLVNDLAWIDALGVVGTLSSTSPFVTILDAEGTYGDIGPGNIGINIIDRYRFSVSEDAPSGPLPFALHVTANSESSHPYEIDLEFEVDVSMWQIHFPVEMSSPIVGGNAIVDLDGNGTNEVVVGGGDSLLHVFTTDGSELAGFPVLFGSKIEAAPAIGDVDNDGDLEIVVGSLDYNLYVVQHDGSAQGIYTSDRYIYATPSLYDLDGDGDLEIIQPVWDYELQVLHHDGTPVENFPIELPGERMTVGAAVADLNADGAVEIIVGTWDYLLHAFQLDGTELTNFPVAVSNRVRGAPAVANLDDSEDGSLEIVIGSDDDHIHVIDNAGTILWSYSNSAQNIQAAPSVSDLDGDEDLEIVFGSLDRSIYALDHEGNLLPGWPQATSGAIYSAPVMGDIDDDGFAEIFVGSDDHSFYGFHLDGTLLPGFPILTEDRIQATPTLGDLDMDGDLEAAVGSDAALLVVDLPGTSLDGPSWTTARGNYHRTGHFSLTPVFIAGETQLPTSLKLESNYPNPFNPVTHIGYALPARAEVRLEVLDLRGHHVATLVHEQQLAGEHQVQWLSTDDFGNPVAAGLYFYRLHAGSEILVRKMTLLK